MLNINPLNSDRFFPLILNSKHGMVHCKYLGVSGYDFQKILYLIV